MRAWKRIEKKDLLKCFPCMRRNARFILKGMRSLLFSSGYLYEFSLPVARKRSIRKNVSSENYFGGNRKGAQARRFF